MLFSFNIIKTFYTILCTLRHNGIYTVHILKHLFKYAEKQGLVKLVEPKKPSTLAMRVFGSLKEDKSVTPDRINLLVEEQMFGLVIENTRVLRRYQEVA